MRTTHRLLSAAATVALTAGVLTTTAVTTATAAPAHRATAYDVTIKPSTTELVSGKKITFKGQVSPKAAGQTVVLQQKIGDQGWKPTGTATLNKKGRYEVSDKPSTMLERKYRVVKAASGQHRKGVSKAVAVTIYKWHKLFDLSVRDQSFMYKQRTLSIATVEFPKSFEGGYYSAQDPTGFIDFNLARECITLKATYGMSDDADTDASAKIDVVGDGTELYTGTFALLESQKKTTDIHGVFRLAFQYTALGDAQARPAVGSPEVLCSF
ncbi:NPCBM/NEW2 domain-containing protein [Nocardioides sp. KIGAM211]|uniref:NPCBM/NEW2 domain-containing protein n=1 Tax=Nocardioides luti TaxID=2761101 RepID=A0A7X0V9T1_9ACTN|nr:NPCBM/NEW2 domain-containing protein [Nocardioides luti]MBB6626846.1 NPCBM/NEW2 domain-containing protein [Nocardioides luti]